MTVSRDRVKGGFTLMEVVISSALLLLVGGALISAVLVGRRSVAAADRTIAAMHVARRHMEQLTGMAYGVPQLQYGVHTFTDQIDGRNYQGSYLVSTNAQYPGVVKDIAINLAWVNPGAVRMSSVTLNGVICRYLHQGNP